LLLGSKVARFKTELCGWIYIKIEHGPNLRSRYNTYMAFSLSPAMIGQLCIPGLWMSILCGTDGRTNLCLAVCLLDHKARYVMQYVYIIRIMILK